MRTKEGQRAFIIERREQLRSGLSGLYASLYDQLCTALDRTGQLFWCPTSGLRSIQEQDKIYAQGRTQPGPIVTNAQPGFSAHNWGCATDWAWLAPDLAGEQIYQWADWNTYRDIIDSIKGITWGGDFISRPDKPHNELALKVRWGQVGSIYVSNGESAAWTFIKNNLESKGTI